MKDLAKNPFLVVGVSADADMSEIRQVAQRRMMEHRLDDGENSPAARRVESALEALQDPVQRFTWGLYWPELTAEEAEQFRDDPILSTLGDDPLQDGAVAYDLIAADVSPDIRDHNLGVLGLLQAVAATEEAQKGTPDDISDDLACCEIWERAFRHLLPVVTADAFWMRKKLWAKDLGDKRLNDARLNEIRESYVADLLAPTGAVITTALLDGHAKVAKAYVDVVKRSGFDAQVVEETLSRVYKPLADRVERAVEGLTERLDQIDADSENRSPYARLLSEFRSDALRDLEVMLAVGDLPGYAEEHARDTSAEFLRNLSVCAWNATSDGDLSEEALALAARIADSERVKSKLAEDRKTIERLAEQNRANAQLAPLFEKLSGYLDAKRWKEALPVITAIKNASSGEGRQQMIQLYSTISNNVAVDLCNQAMQALKARRFSQVHTLLDEALRYVTKPSDKQTILMAKSQTPANAVTHALRTEVRRQTGCISFLALIPLGAVAIGVIRSLLADVL